MGMDNDWVMGTCKPGTEECCRYLVADIDGWGCVKNTSMKDLIDSRIALGEFNAKGDNCKGVPNKTIS